MALNSRTFYETQFCATVSERRVGVSQTSCFMPNLTAKGRSVLRAESSLYLADENTQDVTVGITVENSLKKTGINVVNRKEKLLEFLVIAKKKRIILKGFVYSRRVTRP